MMWLLAGLSMFGPFAIDTMFPAFPRIGTEFGVDKLMLQQTISVYLLSYALMCLVHGPVSDAVGRKPVILTGVIVFLLASVGCAMATSMPMLLAFRALQGVSAGVGMIVGRAVIRDLHAGADAQRLMSQISMIFGVAPAIAPVVGGWLLGWGDWRIIFWFLAGFAALIWMAAFIVLPESHTPSYRTPLRVGSLASSYRDILLDPPFLRLSVVAGLNFAGFFVYISSAPEFVLHHLGLGEGDFGWFFAPSIAGMVVGAFASSKLAGKVAPTQQVRYGFILATLAVVSNLLYSGLATHIALPWAVLPTFLYAGSAALIAPVLNLAVLDRFPLHRGAASSMQAFISTAGNAIVAGVVSPLVSHTPLGLALAMAAFALAARLVWMWHLHAEKKANTDRP
ncbi:multidrug effflux MFS transporter [Aquilutibacter rugosus]|uniref:multidrug effflux MFS transporter n=1 Tax=Aquilutibacter rugosus TaxID=3115820 RepID=UPI003CCE5137